VSRRDLIRMTDAEIDVYVRGRHTMNIATFAPDGTIHLVAMWYGFHGDHLAFETFAKSQKVQNLRRDDRNTALIETGETYDQLRVVEIVGRGIVHDDPDVLMGVARDVVRRYFSDDPDTPEADIDAIAVGLANKRVAIEIVPDKIVSGDPAKLGGMY
jgi:PPOX class probable F420-dependent enzyme